MREFIPFHFKLFLQVFEQAYVSKGFEPFTSNIVPIRLKQLLPIYGFFTATSYVFSY